MHSVQILLPLYQNGEALPSQYFNQLRDELVEKFGGITAYTRAPATGLWKENEGKTVKDEIIIYEIMADKLDKEWWISCRKRLESLFRQDEIIIRTWEIQLL